MAIEDLIICCVCHGTLGETEAHSALICEDCGRQFPYRDGIPDLTPIPPPDEEVLAKWSLWEQLQAKGANEYLTEPEANLAIGDRADIECFAEYCQLYGRVLDVGCGPQARPSYAGAIAHFVGIDPLQGVGSREFEFVQGIGEYLPFRDGCFDHVLFAGTLEHLLDPIRALREAARVLAAEGTIELLTGDWPEPPSRARSAVNGLRMLSRGEIRELLHGARVHLRLSHTATTGRLVPRGAADEFHFFHPTRRTIDSMIAAAGLRLLDDASVVPEERFIRVASSLR